MSKKRTMAKRIEKIPPSGIRELFNRAQGIPGVISLGIGQPNIPTPEPLIEKLVSAVRGGDNYYSPTPGTPKYRKAISEQLKRDYNLEYNPSNEILATASGCEAIYAALMAHIDPGDEVLIPDPSFLTYSRQVRLAGGIGKWVKPKADLTLDLEDVKEKITSKTKAIIINFPSNPTGKLMSEEGLQSVVDLAVDNDIIILSDEVYDKTIFAGEKHVSVPTLNNAFNQTLLIYSFSKTFCVPGWRIGYVAGPKELIAPITKMHSFIVANAPSAQQNAIGEFLNTPEAKEFTDKLCKILEERKKKIVPGFNAIDGFECLDVEGSFYAFPKVSNHKYYTTSKELSEKIFEEQKVVLVPGDEFGPSGEGYLRASFGSTNLDTIDEVLERLSKI
ncbi:MAG: aminotransferase class I/II-fold pyridoxal phosphate-dependent enzyme [Promethearchaeota archaeon]|nr:MAG: aminotransferase class I/II-fold pyridoxal phosphate-dependent enzyme [Candidatus Lokiarchaeota archaeon]